MRRQRARTVSSTQTLPADVPQLNMTFTGLGFCEERCGRIECRCPQHGTGENAVAASARRNLTDSVPAYLLINPHPKVTTKTMGDYRPSLIVTYVEIDIHSTASSTYDYQRTFGYEHSKQYPRGPEPEPESGPDRQPWMAQQYECSLTRIGPQKLKEAPFQASDYFDPSLHSRAFMPRLTLVSAASCLSVSFS